MATDHIRYDILAQEALRGVVRTILKDAAKNGLPGEHHFFIDFDTTAPGVKMSARLREQHPKEIRIILQHQFWDLMVHEDAFEVGLSFGGVPERLTVPFDAIKGFFDPSVQFGLQFETVIETTQDTENDDEKPAGKKADAPARIAASRSPAETPAPDSAESDSDKPAGAEVVRLDRFRKK